MYCGNCGIKLEDNMSVCPNCQMPTDEYEAPSPQNNLDVKNVEQLQTYTPYVQKEKLPVPISVALGVVSVLFALFLGMIVYVYAFGGAGSGKGFDLYCEQLPIQTDKQSIILSGTIKSSKENATLTLNGQVIETVSPKEKEKMWNEAVTLESGENIFVLTFADVNGRSESRVLNIERQSELVYPEGTVLNLTTTGVYVRPTPNKSDKFVVMLWDKSTDLVCLGEESTDAEGYLWCKVNTPSNGDGWIRTDLVKVKH